MASSVDRFLTRVGYAGIALGVASFVPYNCLYTVDGGERAVLFRRFGGLQETPVKEGTHFLFPWFQTAFIYNIRTKPKVINTTTGTKDLQMVSISLRLLYRPKEQALAKIHQTLGPEYDECVLPSIGNEIMKAVVVRLFHVKCNGWQARYDAEKLLTQRDAVSKDVREAIVKRAREFDIILDDVAITHLAYGKEYSKAIEEKQVAQQEAERLKFIVLKAEHERQAAVIKAEAEAEAANVISKALEQHGSALIQLRRIETAKDIAQSLSKSRGVTYLPSGKNLIYSLPSP